MLNLTHQSLADFAIGSIVTFCTHPFFGESDKDSILISGDPSTLPPLMVIVETNKEVKSVFDENSGMEIINKGSFQCKVQWYASESSSFEEAWVSSTLLKTINSSSDTEKSNKQEYKYGSIVVFKTAQIEVAKKKASLKQNGTLHEDRNKSITGILSFTSPVMQVIGVVQSDNKKVYDQKTGQLKKQSAKELIKCKYYNPKGNKLSEVVFAKEALLHIESVPQDVINFLERVIEKGGFLKTVSENNNFKQTIIKPQSIFYKLGSYFLEAKDYLQNKLIEVLIGPNREDQFGELLDDFQQLPIFETYGQELRITPIRKETVSKLSQSVFWRIKYRDSNDNITTRTVYQPEYFHTTEIDPDDEDNIIQIDYLKAKCILRNHQERFFRIDRIQRIEVLEIDAIQNLKIQIEGAGADVFAQP
jgi:hypothetical protein